MLKDYQVLMLDLNRKYDTACTFEYVFIESTFYNSISIDTPPPPPLHHYYDFLINEENGDIF